MRTTWRLALCAGAILLQGCGEPANAGTRDEAVFELGGEAPALSKWLERARDSQSKPKSTSVSPLVMKPHVPKLPVRVRIVRLPPGETLSDLCRRELGDANAWRRVAEFNEWSEADLRRLSPNTEVRIPVD